MTAPVISLESRRRNPLPTYCCARHRLDALVERSLSELAGTADALLIPREVLADVVDDLVTSVRAALVENSERAGR
jgi:hypothetical protein